MIVTSILLTSLLCLAVANPVARNMVVHEVREAVPDGFVHSGAAAADTTLNLRIALVRSDVDGLQKALFDVSTPGSALYGQHITKEEAEAFMRPPAETTAKITEWLTSNGLTATSLSPTGDWLAVSMFVSKANSLFDADFSVFTHEATGKQSVLTLSYSIPADLQGHIDLVHPTITFPTYNSGPVFKTPIKSQTAAPEPGANVSPGAVPSSCESVVTPACLQTIYGIPATLATQPSNQLAVSGFTQQFANQADLTTFTSTLRPDLPPNATMFNLLTVNGGTNSQDPADAGVEANLDTQYTVGVASGVPVNFISVGPNVNHSLPMAFLDIINFLSNMMNPPQVLTTSYGLNENSLSRALAINVCNAFAALGARGVSILFASGDGGVAGPRSTQCTTFQSTFPSGCPFMTSVGATRSINEAAANFSSGGFSNFFATPSYQSTAVSTYLTALGNSNDGKFNRTGRAFPDVSAQGKNFEIVFGTVAGLVDGTSCSSPTFASIVSLLNDRLAAAGKPPLGFLNPFLYSDAGTAALNDITTGSNPGCNTTGFPAKVGWDPVTGLGTPNFVKLLVALGLPPEYINRSPFLPLP